MVAESWSPLAKTRAQSRVPGRVKPTARVSTKPGAIQHVSTRIRVPNGGNASARLFI